MFILIILLPFLSALVAGIGGGFIGKQGVCFITCGCIILSTLCSYLAFYEVCYNKCNFYLDLGTWFSTSEFDIQWSFMFDSLTVCMLVLVTTISTCVHIYSTEYMQTDPHLIGFMCYLSLFTLFMIILVTAANFVQLFLGWEGVGLCSYLLINFWHLRPAANIASLKAILVNGIGDAAVLLCMVLFVIFFGSLDFHIIFSIASFYENYYIIFINFQVKLLDIICFLLFIGAVGKSAQISLHTWLPDAMEGPTPVSALIHAATMVTAGIFLIIRCSFLFKYAPSILGLITFTGAFTVFFTSTIGVMQNDIKKVIAYSTCSQLGYMLLSCGLSDFTASLFHLINHGFFKALSFLSAGCVIHAFGGEQDLGKFGGGFGLLPYTYSMMFIGSCCLMGFPFLTGFYSKDIIIQIGTTQYIIYAYFVIWFDCITLGCSTFYSFKFLHKVFWELAQEESLQLSNIHPPGLGMKLPLGFLALLSIFFGYLFHDFFINNGSLTFNDSIAQQYAEAELEAALICEFVPYYYNLMPSVFTAVGILGAYLEIKLQLFTRFYNHGIRSVVGKSSWFITKKWLFDFIYNNFFVKIGLICAYLNTYKLFDKGFLELWGAYGIGGILVLYSRGLRRMQSGLLSIYIAWFFYWSLFYLFIVTFIV